MAFKKGHDPNRAKGRPVGAKGKATTLTEQLITAGFSDQEVVSRIVDIARVPEHPRHFDALKELLDRIHPKTRQVDIGLDPEKSVIKVIFEDYTKK